MHCRPGRLRQRHQLNWFVLCVSTFSASRRLHLISIRLKRRGAETQRRRDIELREEMDLLGRSIIGARRGEASSVILHGFNPATGETLEPAYHGATPAEID